MRNDSMMEVRMTSEIQAKAKELAELILNSEEYQNYIKSKEVLKADKELYNKVNELRRRNYFLQVEEDENSIYDEMCKMQNEFATIRQDNRVDKFLRDEVSLCRMIQQINKIVTKEIDFELDFF